MVIEHFFKSLLKTCFYVFLHFFVDVCFHVFFFLSRYLIFVLMFARFSRFSLGFCSFLPVFNFFKPWMAPEDVDFVEEHPESHRKWCEDQKP